jgi:hypothetical protein
VAAAEATGAAAAAAATAVAQSRAQERGAPQQQRGRVGQSGRFQRRYADPIPTEAAEEEEEEEEEEEALDPISLEPLSALPYPPFPLAVDAASAAQPAGGGGDHVQMFDGQVLANYLLSTSNFTHPVRRCVCRFMSLGCAVT